MDQLTLSKPTKENALDALKDMQQPSVWAPGIISIILLFLLGQNFFLCAAAVVMYAYVNRLWNRLEKK